MVAMKKALYAILSVIICFVMLNTTALAGASYVDINDMADTLNKLNILQGSNGEYSLDETLERSQATAFIIRMIGKEQHVKENADQYSFIKFTDVISNAWYVPYVGYGTQFGIIGGITDDSFAPQDKTSEKAFLKMALCALGYVYGEDFNWTNVFQKAYEVGIVTDESYKERVQDNLDYLRREAIEVIHKSLNTFVKGTDIKLAYTLVDEGVMTRDELMDSGIFGEAVPVEIESMKAISPDNVEIQLSSGIKELNMTDIEVYEEGTEKSLEVKSFAFRDESIQVITSGQIPGKPYTLTIKSFIDSYGNIAGPVTGTFVGYTPMQVISDFFRIHKVEQTSVNVIDVYFTHPVNISSESAVNYELFKNGNLFLAGSAQTITVKKLQSVQNAVSILLKNNVFEPGKVYTLRVSGKLASSYGVHLSDGYGEAIDFTATMEQADQLEILQVTAWSNNSVKILFNQEIDPVWASKRLNYTIYNAYRNTVDVTQVAVTEDGKNNGKEVILSLAAPLDKTKQYELNIEYIPDLYKQSAIESKSVLFSGSYLTSEELAIVGGESEHTNYIVLYFNKALDPVEATDFSKYVIRGVDDSSSLVIPKKVSYTVENGKFVVRLYLPDYQTLKKSDKYIVYVSNLKDLLGTANKSLLRYEFTERGSDIIKPEIIDAVTISNESIKLLFNMEIAFNQSNMNTTNYMLEYEENGEIVRKVPIGITYFDPVTLILRFDELDKSRTYKLRFSKMYDYSEEYTSTVSDKSTTDVRWGR